MKRIAFAALVLVTALVAASLITTEPITVHVPYVATWHIPVGPQYEAIPSARPAD